MAEDRERIRVLRRREQEASPGPRPESIASAVANRKGDVLANGDLRVEVVFTAHPTEAKRRSVRRKLNRIRDLLKETDAPQLPGERQRTMAEITAELVRLWQTNFIRAWRPSVLQEVRRGLAIQQTLWDVAPKIVNDLRTATEHQPGAVALEDTTQFADSLRFGSWIGGDRDGHPYVTVGVTAETIEWLRDAALTLHQNSCHQLVRLLSLSTRQVEIAPELIEKTSAAIKRWPGTEDQLQDIAPDEPFRRWLRIIGWRLKQTAGLGTATAATNSGAYGNAMELHDDVKAIYTAVKQTTGGELHCRDILIWLDQIRVFGFHLTRLDIRQDARVYSEVAGELLAHFGAGKDLSQDETLDAITEHWDAKFPSDKEIFSEKTRETLLLFQLIATVYQQSGPQAFGGHVMSMTSHACDVMTVQWFWKMASEAAGVDARLPIVPLFETIEDLENAPQILAQVLSVPAYREYVAAQDNRQMVMLGYSDSTKDGGYLASCWNTYRAQELLFDTAAQAGVNLTFFHGRGGSLGRGGGPADRLVYHLPPGAFNGSLRLTEQGEVIADYYDNPAVCYRRIEQLMAASIAVADEKRDYPGEWTTQLNELASVSVEKYRQLIELPGFVPFFRKATPIVEIEQLPIGSRPARRKGDQGLSSLRAIPWVFSWTQSRCLLPAWYGIGSALESCLQDDAVKSQLVQMYQNWPFFQSVIRNAESALGKASLEIFRSYAQMAAGQDDVHEILTLIESEYELSCRVILAITGRGALLEDSPWLQESIRVRRPFLDPLHQMQIELIRRMQQLNQPEENVEAVEEIRHLTRLTIKGIAAGMRSTG